MPWLSPMIEMLEAGRAVVVVCLAGVVEPAFFLADCLDERELKFNFRMKPSQAVEVKNKPQNQKSKYIKSSTSC